MQCILNKLKIKILVSDCSSQLATLGEVVMTKNRCVLRLVLKMLPELAS